jgi:predicted transcriptional regulator
MTKLGAAEAGDAARLAFEPGRWVRKLRVEQRLSQTELARRAGVTQPAVVRFKAGGTVPPSAASKVFRRSMDCRSVP